MRLNNLPPIENAFVPHLLTDALIDPSSKSAGMRMSQATNCSLYGTCKRFFLLVSTLTLCGVISHAQQTAVPRESTFVSRNSQAMAMLQNCVSAMGSPAADLAIQAEGTATPLAKGGPTTQLTLRAQGISSLRIDSVSQMPSGKTLTDSLIYGNGRGRWTPDEQYQAHFYSAARYSHPQLIPVQLCSVALMQTNLSVELIQSEADDPPGTVHVRSFLDMRDPSDKTDVLTSKLSQLDIYLDSFTYLPVRAKSFSFDPSNLFNSISWRTDYTQFTAIEGLRLPMIVTETLGSLKIRTIAWTSLTTNANLDESIFDLETN